MRARHLLYNHHKAERLINQIKSSIYKNATEQECGRLLNLTSEIVFYLFIVINSN